MDELAKKLEQIKQANWHGQKPYYQQRAQNAQVQVKPDPSVGRGKFKPDPRSLGAYLAHPMTIRALKKDLLLAGDDLLAFAQSQPCPSCHTTVDRQFWNFCPHCEAPWP